MDPANQCLDQGRAGEKADGREDELETHQEVGDGREDEEWRGDK